MNDPADSPSAIRSRLPNGGERFLAHEAALAMEDFYRTERLEGYDDDSLVVVANKFGKGADRRFEIGFFRSFDMKTQLEVVLSYPTNLRSLFLRSFLEICDSLADAERLFRDVRQSRWFRRYATVPPIRCSIRWCDEDEMAQKFGTILPMLMEAMGPHW